MSSPTQSVESDLAFLRALAEAGHEAPLMAGPSLIAGGAWFAAASLVHWLIAARILEASPAGYFYAWIGAAVGFAATLVVLHRRDRHRSETTNNRAVNAAWSAVGCGIGIFWMGLAIISWRSGNNFVWVTMPLLVLTVYGVAWWVASALTQQRWMKLTTAITFASVLLAALLHDTHHLYLFYAASLVVTALIPGLVLLRQDRSPGA